MKVSCCVCYIIKILICSNPTDLFQISDDESFVAVPLQKTKKAAPTDDAESIGMANLEAPFKSLPFVTLLDDGGIY